MASSLNENANHEEEYQEMLRSKETDIAKRDAMVSSDEFCGACSTVAFESMLFGCAACHTPAGFRATGTISLATVKTIFANKRCPACRLIASLVSSHPCRVPEAAKVSLFSQGYSFQRRSERGTRDRFYKQPKWVGVKVCSHGLNEEYENRGKDDYVGSLLPVKEDENSGISGGHYHRDLYEIPEHEGYICAREVRRRVDGGMIRAWMRFCEENHEDCEKRTSNGDDETSVRLIDVRKRRLVVANLKEKYLALSYVWGQDTAGVLTTDTMESLKCEGSLTKAAVPRAIFDTMELVAELGERYLWVDTACIIQDDISDKQRQLPIMDSIYSHAKLVIIAAVENANSRLPRWGESQHRANLHTEVLRGVRFASGQTSLELAMHSTAWNERGWTFQEALLARRALVFTESQVYWNCREESWCEDRYTEFKDVRNVPSAHNSLLALPLSGVGCGNHEFQVERLCAMGDYRQKVEQYSKRKFSDNTDVLWAFIGILKSLKDKFPKGYIWGLPYDELDAALLWRVDCAVDRNPGHIVRGEGGSFHRLPIPSWCWISKGCKAWYETCGDSVVPLVKWHKPIWYNDEYNMPMNCRSCLMKELKSSVFVDAETPEIEPALAISDFGLLHFTAQAATLNLQPILDADLAQSPASSLKRSNKNASRYSLALARIQLPSGKDVGELSVPMRIFSDGAEDRREFILLSKHAGEGWGEEAWHGQDDAPHIPGCRHSPAFNIMLIEWKENRRGAAVASRVAIGRIRESVWKEVEAKEKNIILA